MTGKEHWLEHLHRTNDWRTVADFLVANETYLAPSMADFARSVRAQRVLSRRQLDLLISLTAGVFALKHWDSLGPQKQPEPPPQKVAAKNGTKGRAADKPYYPCGGPLKNGGKCALPMARAGDRCRRHGGKLSCTDGTWHYQDGTLAEPPPWADTQKPKEVVSLAPHPAASKTLH